MDATARRPTITRQQRAGFLIEILVNFVLPYVIYIEAKPQLGDVHALMASSLPPIAWSLFEFVRKRRIDAISLIVIIGIVLSLLAFIGGGSVRFLQLRENLVTIPVALAFLISAAIGKPIIYQFARASMMRKSPTEAEKFAALQQHASFRRGMTIMTLVWGFGLLASTALACILVFSMSIRDYLIVSPILGYGTMGTLGLWSFWYSRRMKRRGEARRALGRLAAGPS